MEFEIVINRKPDDVAVLAVSELSSNNACIGNVEGHAVSNKKLKTHHNGEQSGENFSYCSSLGKISSSSKHVQKEEQLNKTNVSDLPGYENKLTTGSVNSNGKRSNNRCRNRNPGNVATAKKNHIKSIPVRRNFKTKTHELKLGKITVKFDLRDTVPEHNSFSHDNIETVLKSKEKSPSKLTHSTSSLKKICGSLTRCKGDDMGIDEHGIQHKLYPVLGHVPGEKDSKDSKSEMLEPVNLSVKHLEVQQNDVEIKHISDLNNQTSDSRITPKFEDSCHVTTSSGLESTRIVTIKTDHRQDRVILENEIDSSHVNSSLKSFNITSREIGNSNGQLTGNLSLKSSSIVSREISTRHSELTVENEIKTHLLHLDKESLVAMATSLPKLFSSDYSNDAGQPDTKTSHVVNVENPNTSISQTSIVENKRKTKTGNLAQSKATCSICNKTFGRNPDLRRHLKTHSGDRPFGCDVCDKTFTQKNHLKRHLKAAHNRELSKVYQCGLCECSFDSQYNLERHFVSHGDVLRFACEACGKMFRTKRNMQEHIMVHHLGKKRFQCHQCTSSFSRKEHLNRHLIMHTGQKPYSCSKCEKEFLTRGNLTAHFKRIHLQEKNYACGECGKTFFSNKCLKTHLIVHTGERPHTCDICLRSFSMRASLRSHLSVHTGEKPYICETCDYGYTRSAHLQRHLKRYPDHKMKVEPPKTADTLFNSTCLE